MEVQKQSDWYFHGPAGSSKSDIWQWWRERRFRYNRDLLFVGVGTWLLVMFAGSAAVKPGVDFEEPMMMVVGPPFYAIFANLAYCGFSPIPITNSPLNPITVLL